MAYNGNTDGQVKTQYKCRDCRAFQRDVKYLEHLLDKERARGRQQREWRLTLCQALDEAHEKLAKLQSPGESYSEGVKDTWQEENCLEEGDCNIETQQSGDCEEEIFWDEESWQPRNCSGHSKTFITTETTKQNQETDVNRYYKELQEELKINQHRFALELQAAKSTSEALQDELRKVKASYTDLEKANTSQIQTFQAEQDALHRQMMEKMTCLQKNAVEDKILLQREVEELTQLNAQLSLKERENKYHIINQQRLAVELQAEKSTTEALQHELEKIRVLYNDISQRCEPSPPPSKPQKPSPPPSKPHQPSPPPSKPQKPSPPPSKPQKPSPLPSTPTKPSLKEEQLDKKLSAIIEEHVNINDMKNVEFTLGKESKKSQEKKLSSAEQKEQLDTLIQDKADNHTISDWIENNLDEQQTSSNTFIRTLMTCICQSTIISGENYYIVDHDLIRQRATLLQKYLQDEEKQLQALFALQALMVQMDHPSQLLRMFFDCLYDFNVITVRTFYKWELNKDPAEQQGKDVALQSVTGFFAWLHEVN